jgi:hypothetical protein
MNHPGRPRVARTAVIGAVCQKRAGRRARLNNTSFYVPVVLEASLDFGTDVTDIVLDRYYFSRNGASTRPPGPLLAGNEHGHADAFSVYLWNPRPPVFCGGTV